MLVFPASLYPDFVIIDDVADYPTDFFTSEEGLEWASLQSCNATDAKLTLRWDKTTLDSCGCYPMEGDTPGRNKIVCGMLEFWQQTRGRTIKFEIEDTHPLWSRMEGIDECYREVYSPFKSWRFAEKPKISTDVCGIYDLSVTLIQKNQCG